MPTAGGPGPDDDAVATYCLSLGVQFGFQTFSSRKTPGSTQPGDVLWHPSTTFIATHALTAALRDVGSRSTTTAALNTPAHLAGLAAAVRDLHGTIFQPYLTWLKAARLRPPSGRPVRSQPDADTLHLELADLALYWLVYSEAANLRHTPEMIWFIFFCAQRSWQAKQVLNHLRLHRDALAALPRQPWLAAHGPGLPRALQSLHAQYRRALSGEGDGGGGGGCGSGGGGGLLSEATLTLPYGSAATVGAAVKDAAAVRMYGESAEAAAAAASGAATSDSRDAVRITMMVDGSVSLPYNAASSCRTPVHRDGGGDGGAAGSWDRAVAAADPGSPSDDARTQRDTDGDSLLTAAARGGGVRRRMDGDSPSLPLPPSPIKTSATATSSTSALTAEKTFVGGNSVVMARGGVAAPTHGSAFAVPGAATGLGASIDSAVVPPPVGVFAPQPPAGAAANRLLPMASTPTAPNWDPRIAPVDYRELLLRICPNEASVAAALAAGTGGGSSGDGSDGCDGGGDISKRGGAGSSHFLERVVQPLFLFLSEQVFELGQARRQGLESAVRIGYDDVSESMAHPRVVAATLAALPWANTIVSAAMAAGFERVKLSSSAAGSMGTGVGVSAAFGTSIQQQNHQQQQQQQQQNQQQRAVVMPRAAVNDEELYWSRLLALSDLPPAASARIPWQGDMAHYRPQLLKLLTGAGGGNGSFSVSGGSGTNGGGGGGGGGAGRVASNAGSSARGGRRAGVAANRVGRDSSDDDDDMDEDDEDDEEEGDEEAPTPTVEQARVAAAAAQAVPPEAAAELRSLRAANAAADWWARHVLRKTFVEHRSLAMPLLAFARVYQFQLVWFYLLCAWSWSGRDDVIHWISSAAALHWGSNCLLWTMQAVMASGATMKRGGAVVPFYSSAQGRSQRGSGPSAPASTQGWLWWVVQLWLLALCWGALAAGIYIAYIVWPNHDLYGLQCYPLFWSRSCYWWIAVVYGGLVLSYEMLYRQFNLGGYARAHVYDWLLRMVPGGGTAAAASASSPMYDPSAHLRTNLQYLLGNSALWVMALGLKFVIDYFILVKPAGQRLAEIMATDKLAWSFYINWGWWPEGWARNYTVDLDPLMAAAQVIVLFLLSMVSTGVSYSVACAALGALQGVRQGLGSIRHWAHIRAGFHRVQAAMRVKLLCKPDEARLRENRSFAFRVAATCCTALATILLLPFTATVAALRWAGCLPPPRDDKPKSWEQREETLALTAPFWNAVVRSLRGRDLLSNREAEALSFVAVSLSPASMMATWRRAGSGPEGVSRQSLGAMEMRGPRETYLPPVAVYVAQIPAMVITGSATGEQLEALQEAYLYLLHLLVAVGAIPRSAPPTAPPPGEQQGPAAADAAAAAVSAAAAAAHHCPDLHKDNFHPDKFVRMPARAKSHKRLVARRELLGAVMALVRGLVDTGKVYKDTAGSVHGGASAAKAAVAAAVSSRGRAIDKLCMALHAAARCMTQMHDLPWSVAVIANRVVVRQHYHQAPVKAALDRGFNSLVAQLRNNATAWGAEHMPSYEDFSKVSTWLLAILRPSDEGTAPSSPEALGLLSDFCAGLVHPGLPAPPRVEAMRSVSTLIPHYQETVLYALSSADARRVVEREGDGGIPGSKVSTAHRVDPNATAYAPVPAAAPPLEGSLADDEVLFKNDEGAPSELLQYLVSEFPEEFRHLLERCRSVAPLGKQDPPYCLEDFLPFGRLHEHRAQLLLWASFRGQVLARTVDGMCMYRTALALQAVQDAMASPSQFGGGDRGSKGGAAGGGGGGGAAGVGDGRLKLSGVQRMMVRGIMRDTNLSVEELVAQLADVVPGLGPLLERKYGLVVSSQVYAKMAGSRSLADRWRAHGIRLLATRYPALKVAYLEQDGEPLALFKAPDFTYRVVHQASVLMRAVPIADELEAKRRARAERANAAAAAAAFAYGGGGGDAGSMYSGMTAPSVLSAAWWKPGGGDGGGGGGGGGVAASMDTCSNIDGSAGSDDDEDDSGGDDAGAVLRLWRRRHLLKDLHAADLEVLFRQQLPVNYYDTNAHGVGVILGEGKPENQNTAVPYCTGLVLQTIDMNQDNSLAQAFKLRNATREFEPLGPGPQAQQVAVVGYPEWIFSYRCGLLADLAAATERTFGTQIQRVMAYPSAVRLHYGHPDMWNKLFSMTRGGVSKANAVQHVSEDVFGGMNALKRGGLSKYVSYISVGKGRDMGLDSILGFEAKISKGCAEQLLSRDVRFLGNHMDFFRSMSLYCTGPGHFINTWLTVLTIHLGIWVQLMLLLGGVSETAGSLASAMGAVQILQLGTLPLLGYLFNLWLESGLATALATLFRQFIAGGLLFHIFRSCTSAFALGRAALFGGAGYIATGRGFSLRRRTFTQVYVNYGRSHLYLGADVLIMVILILVAGNNGGNALPVPAAAMWSPLLVAAALLAGPFWFTPFFFRLSQVMRDTREFRAWVAGSAARGQSEGWAEWNAGQLGSLRDDSKIQVRRYRFWSTLAVVVPKAAIVTLSTIVAVTGAHFDTPDVPDLLWVLGGSVASWTLLWLWAVTRRAYMATGLAQQWRWAKGSVQVLAVLALAGLVAVCVFMEKRGLRFAGVLITLYANYQVASLLVCIAVMWFPKTMMARSLANSAYRQADAALGTVIAAVLIIICFIGEIGLIMVDRVQTLVQFNDRYSHTAAARPYNGDDDPAAGAAGGGLAAAAAAALRRRIPSHQALGVVSGGGAGAGGGGGGGGAPRGSGPPSVLTGWVSPGLGGGRVGGSTTPVVMYGSTNVANVLVGRPSSGALSAGGSVPAAAAVPANYPAVAANYANYPFIGAVGANYDATVGGGNTATSSGAATPTFTVPSPPSMPPPPMQQHSRLAMPRRPSGNGGAVAAVSVMHAPSASSKDLSWSSGGLVPLPFDSRPSQQLHSAAGAAAPSRTTSGLASPSAASEVVPFIVPTSVVPSVPVAPTVIAVAAAPPRSQPPRQQQPRQQSDPSRLPRTEDWQTVANAAAEAALSRGGQQQPQPLQPPPNNQRVSLNGSGPMALPMPAWGSRPASGRSTGGGSSVLDNVPLDRSGRGGGSPMRSRQMARPLSAADAGPDGGAVARVLPPIRPSPRVSPERGSAGSGGGGVRSLRGSLSGSGGSFAAPATVLDGALSGWVQPRSQRYEVVSGGGAASGGGVASGGGAGGSGVSRQQQ